MGKKRKTGQTGGPGLGTALALVVGTVLVVIPDPVTTATGLAILAGTVGFQATK